MVVGKALYLMQLNLFVRQFCKAIGKPFNDSVFIFTATANTAAAQLKGDTIQSIAGLWRKLSSILKNWSLNWVWAKILFIDEISMMDIMDFLKLDKYLHQLMAQFNPEALNYPFGGLNISFFVVIFHSSIQLVKRMLFMINKGMHYGVWSIGLITLPWPSGDF